MEKYGQFGLSFSKAFLIEKGANPVFYICKESKPPSGLKRVDKITEMLEKFNKLGGLHGDLKAKYQYPDIQEFLYLYFRLENDLFDIFGFMKPFSGEFDEVHEDNYYMEREWRLLTNLEFKLDDVQRIIIPKDYAKQFRQDVPDCYGQVTFIDRTT